MKKVESIVLVVTVAYTICRAPIAWSSSATPSYQLAEIVVTAEKLKQNIQNVGMTVFAITPNQLADRHIATLQSMVASVAGLTYAPSTTDTPIFTLNGVGFNESSLGAYPDVSLYLDQAPLPFPVLASHAIFDLQRIEVMKGPQGTLYGQNSTGGAIDFITAEPTRRFDTGGSVTYGRFNRVGTSGFVSGPITNKLQARFAFTTRNMDKWQHSYTHRAKNGSVSYYAARLLLNWEPTSSLRVHFDANGWVDRSEPQAMQLILVRPADPTQALPSVLAAEETVPFPPLDPLVADWSPGKNSPKSDRRFFQGILRADYKFARNVTLTSLTSYDHYDQKQATDGDGTYLVTFDLSTNNGTIRSFYQEVRLANSPTERLRWIIGGNYQKNTVYENQILNYQDNTTSNPSLLLINSSGVINLQHMRNYAFFANGRYKVLPKVSLSLGARYTSSRDSDYNCGYSSGDGRVGELFNLLGDELGTVPFTPIPIIGGCYTLNQYLVPGQPFLSSLTQNNVSWRAALDFHATRGVMLYVSASRGYKAGSYPTLAASTFRQLRPVTQESLTAYQVGMKSTVFNGRAQLNAATFYYNYLDKQERGKELDPIFGILDTLVNVPKSRIYGADVELRSRPLSGLSVDAAITLLKSEIVNYTGVNVLGLSENFSGQPLPFAPQLSGFVDAEYRFQLRDGYGMPFLGVTVHGESNADATFGAGQIVIPSSPLNRVIPGVTHPYELNPYALLDVRLGYASASGRWRVTLWGKNVLNKYYWTNVIAASDVGARMLGLPARYGITFSYRMH